MWTRTQSVCIVHDMGHSFVALCSIDCCIYQFPHAHDYDLVGAGRAPIRIVPPSERKALRARSEDEIDLYSIVGQRTRLVTEAEADSLDAAAVAGGGYFCKVCQVAIKDSNTYLDHLNSARHLAASGIASRAVKSTLADVRKRLRQPPRQLQQQQQQQQQMRAMGSGVDERRMIGTARNDDGESGRIGTESSGANKKTTGGGKSEDDGSSGEPACKEEDEMMRALGFAGFSTTKK